MKEKEKEFRSVHIREFPMDLQRKLKSSAALDGKTVRQVFIDAVTEYLKRKKRG